MNQYLRYMFVVGMFFYFIAPMYAAASAFKPLQAVIVAAEADAAKAGERMLQQGGNAFDAAAAVALALGVVEPGSSGIGGGGFFLLYLAKEKRVIMLDARETSPKLAGHGEIYDHYSSIDGAQSAGVPGLLAGIDHLVQHYGVLSRQAISTPAITLAKNGFIPNKRLLRMLKWRNKAFNAEARKIFLPQKGRVHQWVLARTLTRYAKLGVDDFYRGETAKNLVADMRRDGGLIRADDLAAYQAIEREPITINWHGYRIVSVNLPSSGGMVLAEVLGILKNDDLSSMPALTQKKLLIESMRRAYKDRNENLGDRDFVSIPDLLKDKYLEALRQSIDSNKATPSSSLGNQQEPAGAGRDTTHFSIIDQDGNMVVATLSINYPFGSAYVSPATGILLNDEMDDFATRPNQPNAYGLVQGKANAVAPGKRMLSSMTPTLVFGSGRIFLLGTPGGSRIISMVLLASMGFMLNDYSSEEWVQSPRYHHQFLPDVIQYEQGAFSDQERKTLTAQGYTFKKVRDYGNMQAIVCDKETRSCHGISDHRGNGIVLQVPMGK
ncbi:MAG: gamma-glutamyltransferase [Mariprofundaceae bacterium]|nr:gamma-glutamyltransferase [Mariprofundaceae bacterium]